MVAVPVFAVGCGGSRQEAKSAQTSKKKVEGKPQKAKEVEADQAMEEKVKEKKKVAEYQRITIKEDEVDLNPGVSIGFAANADTFSGDETYEILWEIYSAMVDNPEIRLRVEGNTDNSGGRDQNLDLSARRALRVFDFLVEAGIDSSRLDFVGCGPDNPIIDNDTPNNRAINRRVDFIIMKDTAIVCGGVYN
ncbi:MAG: OmpA family protein [Polyangiaceae bacterium]